MNKNDEFITAFAKTIGKDEETTRNIWKAYAEDFLTDSDRDAIEMVGAANGIKEGKMYLEKQYDEVIAASKETSFDKFYSDQTPGNAVALAIDDLKALGNGTPEFFAALNRAKDFDAIESLLKRVLETLKHQDIAHYAAWGEIFTEGKELLK